MRKGALGGGVTMQRFDDLLGRLALALLFGVVGLLGLGTTLVALGCALGWP